MDIQMDSSRMDTQTDADTGPASPRAHDRSRFSVMDR